MSTQQDLALNAKAWPFEEARKVLKRIGNKVPEKGYVLFETGYGPSGLPHIGTFGEVCRTSMVRRAFTEMSDIPTKLICFSDDMDGLRSVPTNVPNREMLAKYAESKDVDGNVLHFGTPLSRVPDPFETYDSFGQHNNTKLCEFLDKFGFDYEFVSSTDKYMGGEFNSALIDVLRHWQEIRDFVCKGLSEERQKTYCPFLPIVEHDGRLQVMHHAWAREADVDKGTMLFVNPLTNEEFEHPVTDGHAKLQWRVDWAMRWHALDVDYEMSGKDLIDSVTNSSKVCRILGSKPPETYSYELFLDEKGQKISKSKGNGLTMEEWLRYAPTESLSLYMFQKPRTAKRLYFDVIPKAVDEYLTFVEKYPEINDPAKQLESPAWHIHGPDVPHVDAPLTFNLLLNLASVVNADNKDILWGFISRYAPQATPESAEYLDKLAGFAVVYYQDFIKPNKQYRAPDDRERAAMEDLLKSMDMFTDTSEAEDIQTEIYAIGKKHEFEPLRDWFKALYEVLLGQSEGPRLGSFIKLYGVAETRELIASSLADDTRAAGQA